MDPNIAKRIARLVLESRQDPAELYRNPIVEIGAGTGQLTQALLEEGATNLTALEIDPDLITILNNRQDLKNTTIIRADALTFDYKQFAFQNNWRVVGNLPYNIATPLIMNLVEMPNGPETIVAMIQKDVADRLAAAPATSAYGSLSVAVQYAMHIERAFTLKPGAFYPPPKVDSTVVRLIRREHPAAAPRDEALFKQVVRSAFAYRRKTLANSLALAFGRPRENIARAISASGLPLEIRGEQLDLTAFARLADALAENILSATPTVLLLLGILVAAGIGFVAGFIIVIVLHPAVLQHPRLLNVPDLLIVQLLLELPVVALIWLMLPQLSGFSLRELGFSVPTLRTIGIACTGAIFAIVLSALTGALIDKFSHTKHTQDIVKMFLALHDPRQIAFFAFFAIVLAPIAEETVFRLFLFNLGLRYGGVTIAAITSAILFGLAHGDLFSLIPLTCVGLAFAWIYYTSRNAFASMIAHGLFNAFAVIGLLVTPQLVNS